MPPSLVRPSIQILRLELRHVGTSPVGAYRRTRTACSTSPRTSGSGFATPIPAIAPAAARTPRRARAVASRTSARRQRSRQRALRVIKGGSHLRAPNYRLRSGEISAKRGRGLHDHLQLAMATCSRPGAAVRLDETVDLHCPGHTGVLGQWIPVEPWQTRAWPCTECRARHAPCGIAASDVVTHLATAPSGRNRHQHRGSSREAGDRTCP